MRHVSVFLGVRLAATAVISQRPRIQRRPKSFWLLQPATKTAVPAVTARQWVKNPIREEGFNGCQRRASRLGAGSHR